VSLILQKAPGMAFLRTTVFFLRCGPGLLHRLLCWNIGGVMPEALDLLSLDGRLRQRIAHSFRQNELSDLYTAVWR
jgi:hypothetical protein